MPYIFDDIEYPSVTQILSLRNKGEFFNDWISQCAVDYIKDNFYNIKNCDNPHELESLWSNAKIAYKNTANIAKELGSQVHKVIEKYIKHGIDEVGKLPDEIENAFLAFLTWEKMMKAQWIKSEVTVYSAIFGYAGTADALVKLNGLLYIIDFKSSKSIYDEHAMQLAAYEEAWKESGDGSKIDGIGILRLDKYSGEPEWKDFTNGKEKRKDAFLALCNYYYLEKNRRLKNNHIVKYLKEKYNRSINNV